MSINKILKDLNIGVIEKVDDISKNRIAEEIAQKIVQIFKYIDYNYIITKINKLQIYTAKIPEGITRALYSYEDDALYISEEFYNKEYNDEILHEYVHSIQDVRDKKENIRRLGQCIFSEFKVYGMALNEACVQYIVSELKQEKEEKIEAYGINAMTYSKNKYPLICNLVEQLLFTTNKEILVKSTIYGTDEFLDECIEQIGEINFSNVQSNLDDMLYASEEIIKIKNDIKQFAQKDDFIQKTIENEEIIKKIYIDTQTIIFTSYFDRMFMRIENLYDIQFYEKKLEQYKYIMGDLINNNLFEEYYESYCFKMKVKLEEKRNSILRKENLSLMVVSNNKIIQFFRKIKSILSKILEKK